MNCELMGKPAIRVSEAKAASDLPSLLARVRAGADVVIERNAEAAAVLRPPSNLLQLLDFPASRMSTSVGESGAGKLH
jgi:antitoxin (DNA-binding transcriptional repressor) of toxin-antitoxin stability system